MKRLSKKKRWRDVLLALRHRSGGSASTGLNQKRRIANRQQPSVSKTEVRSWLYKKQKEGLKFVFLKKYRVKIILPPRLNFSDDYEITALNLNVIRRLSSRDAIKSRRGYKLGYVDFDNVLSVSTSVSLVLTAELSRWDDHVKNSLYPKDLLTWAPEVVSHLSEVGFFDLFPGCNEKDLALPTKSPTSTKVIRYIKGRIGDFEKHRELKSKITNIVGGRNIDKWTLLASGISEAITNVGHHAYPDSQQFDEEDKNWYIGGSFDPVSKDLRIVFYDQGIGIPKSLPSSKIKEQVIEFIKKHIGSDVIRGIHDEILLKAAVEIDRTRTNIEDRGKGLHDLLDFIKERGSGYLSIISGKALYKFTCMRSVQDVKTVRFSNVVEGTLIIWKVNLSEQYQVA